MSAAFHSQLDGQTERANASFQQYLWVFFNHQQDDWVQWLPLAEYAANNGISDSTKYTPFFALQGVDPQMSYVDIPTMEWNQFHLEADQVQAAMEQIHQHHQVEMRQSKAIEEEGANQRRTAAPNIHDESQVWLNARHIETTRPTWILNWKWLGLFRVVQPISPYTYE